MELALDYTTSKGQSEELRRLLSLSQCKLYDNLVSKKRDHKWKG